MEKTLKTSATIEEATPVLPVGMRTRAPRRNLGRVPTPAEPPKVRTLEDGAVAVELGGRHGQRKEVILDAADWRKLNNAGIQWMTVAVGRGGQMFVSASGYKARRLAAMSGTSQQGAQSSANIPVGRIIVGAARHEKVWPLDRDPLNLRRENLEAIDREEFNNRVAEMKLCLPIARAILAESGEDWQ